MGANSEKSDANDAGADRWTELIPDPALLCDSEGIILSANSHAIMFFGVTESQLAGVPVQWVIPSRSRDRFVASWNRRSVPMCPCGPEPSPMTIRNSVGRPVAVWTTIDEIKSCGQTKVLMVFNVFPSSGVRDAPREATVAQHLSAVRHEIRSPLSGITIFTDVLLRNRQGNLDDTQIDQLTAIRDAAGDLASRINDIEVPEVEPFDRTA